MVERTTSIQIILGAWTHMRSNFLLLLIICIIAVTSHAQNGQSSSLNLGDPAPPLAVRLWLKGTPVERFEKGHVYVLEFWATWCKPCIAFMPHLSALAREYKDKLSIIGIDIYEKKTTPMEKVKAFVDSMGRLMDYHVAAEDSNIIVAGWLEATGEKDNGIPKTFVVNEEGKLAWIGHPVELSEVLQKIMSKTWDVTEALAKRNEQKRLERLDYEANYALLTYYADQFKPGSVDRPDSALLAINEMVRNEPMLKYAPSIAFHTFSLLLKTNLPKAYEYGKEMLAKQSFIEPLYGVIIDVIDLDSKKLNLPIQIYELGAEAYQTKIDLYGEMGSINVPKSYNNMADLYWQAKNKSKAIEAQQKAIEALKNKKDYSKSDMAAFESRLQQYKKMYPLKAF